MTFVSRYDTWVRIVLWINNLILIGGLAMLFVERSLMSIIVSVFMAVILAGVTWMQFATYYRVDDDTLFVRCGPLHWTIPIASIEAVTPTDDPTAGPAFSMRRVRVEFRKGDARDEIFISPEDREGFIEALRARKSSIATAVPPPA
jgi:hypothetical protein